jgi:hypothetical protein
MRNGRIETLKAEKGAPISALSVSPDGKPGLGRRGRRGGRDRYSGYQRASKAFAG